MPWILKRQMPLVLQRNNGYEDTIRCFAHDVSITLTNPPLNSLKKNCCAYNLSLCSNGVPFYFDAVHSMNNINTLCISSVQSSLCVR